MPHVEAFVKHPLIKPNTLELRSYQQSIVENILRNGNTLVVAPTAMGKTVIAVMLAAHILHENYSNKVLVLAPTRPLAVQHAQSMQRFLAVTEQSVAVITGNMSKQKRLAVWENARIICCTPQWLVNDMKEGKLSLQDVKLAVFDEAHRAVGSYAYVDVAKSLPQDTLIVGLTASPGAEAQRIQEVQKHLKIKNVEVKTEHDEDVRPYVKPIKLTWRSTVLPEEMEQVRKLLKEYIKEKGRTLKELGLVRSTSNLTRKRLLELQHRIHKKLSSNATKHPYLYSAISGISSMIQAYHALTLVETQGTSAFLRYMERQQAKSSQSGASRGLRMFIKHPKVVEAYKLAKELNANGVEHPKLVLLAEVLQHQFRINPQSRVIVFNHYRDNVSLLIEYLGRFEGIKPIHFVGQQARKAGKGMTQKEQKKVLRYFKQGVYNTLVATSVAEEGLDIPSCDLVVFYEPVPSEIRHIQRRGRTARIRPGRVVILLTKGTSDEANYWAALRKERKMLAELREMASTQESMDTYEERKPRKNSGQAKSTPKQTTLLSFTQPDGKCIVYADTRELNSGVVEALQALGIHVAVEQLEVADYVVGKNVAVERKSTSDFLESIVDGRLFKQAVKLKENYERSIIIVEGTQRELYSMRNIHKNAITGALLSLSVDLCIPVLFSKDPKETAELIALLAKRFQQDKRDVRLRIGRNHMSLPERQQFIVESLPGIGPKSAKRLLKHFGTVQGVFDASERDLEKVEGIGKKKAKEIRKTLQAKFEASGENEGERKT